MSPAARRPRLAAPLVALLCGGCVYVQPPRVEMAESGQSVEQVLGTYLLMSAWSPDAESLPALATLYPPRAQLVTYALIAFHRDRAAWPADAAELEGFVASSPANPALPTGALDAFVIEIRPDGSCTYSTAEDRRRGRFFTVTSDYRVSFPVPANPFAGPASPELGAPVTSSTLTMDWKHFPLPWPLAPTPSPASATAATHAPTPASP